MNARYARNILLKEVGARGQQKLNRAKVLVIGIGGVGCAAAAGLAGLGVNLMLCDYDKIEMTNLNRQFLYNEKDIGLDKADVAKNRLEALNSQIKINATMALNNVDFRKFDVVVDCTDNLDARVAISRECKRINVPLIYASATGFVARISVFRKKIYLHELIVKGWNKGKCKAMGIFPPAATIAGSIAASEAAKLILGARQTLEGKILIFDIMKNKMSVLKI